jgi:thiol:disulfide interchange protein
MFHGRNIQQKPIQHEMHHETVQKVLDATEAHAAILDGQSVSEFVGRREGAFVDYYAPWCICKCFGCRSDLCTGCMG